MRPQKVQKTLKNYTVLLYSGADFEVVERLLTKNINNVNREKSISSSTNKKIKVENEKRIKIERDGWN